MYTIKVNHYNEIFQYQSLQVLDSGRVESRTNIKIIIVWHYYYSPLYSYSSLLVVLYEPVQPVQPVQTHVWATGYTVLRTLTRIAFQCIVNKILS